ncbi:hypothetical protein H9657_00210 [Cellulomonas sp. Sa3CUA2]|uniref:Uncharacterized protein n=1 Tax=Cellulomonas avistercoris TaxID=2762242 RepID=A0ABR8Q8F7_9CELL|nr:hypothetical protein [Cellulomonas avistercoris]MBD7916705.1 hypothetical protein [Cellulomonas avistercoris]
MAAALDLPRSVLLALWLTAPAERDRAVAAVQADDEPHTVDTDGEPAPLRDWLTWLGAPVDEVAAVLPVPGEPVAAPAAVSHDAVLAGECVLLRAGSRTVAAVPHVEEFGSQYEPGHLVTWRAVTVPDWRTAVWAQVGTLEDAERDLRRGLLTATEALVSLGVERWRPDAADAISDVRDGALPERRLPRGVDAQRLRVLSSAARLRGIVALAAQDDGGAVNTWQADQRSTALREVDRVARRAMAAAATYLTRP